MYRFAINNPIAVLMFFIALVIFGTFSIFSMPINLYPKVDIPLIKITTTTNGDLKFIESKITKEIENAISDVQGIKNINSTSYNNFSISVVEFELGKNLEVAANDIRDKLNTINLPAKPTLEKISPDAGSVVSLFLSSKDHLKLMRKIDNDIKPFLQKISGVGTINDIAFLKPQVQIKLLPNALQKYHINALDVAKIIQSHNFKQYLGEFENSKDNFTIKGYFEAQNLKELENIRIFSGIFLKDIANISYGLEDQKQFAMLDTKDGVLLELNKISGYNSLKVIENIKNSLKTLQTIAGNEVEIKIVYDKSQNILKHINQVIFDMVFGVILTLLIVYVFLRNISATILAFIVLPTSIISSFFLINLLGYDINRLTIIALTLSIGIFIDDAIVIIESIAKKAKTLPPLQASFEGIKEIGFSVLSISAVLLCVFIPIAYMNSVPGLFFNVLATSVASGVIISYLVSVFLIPTLSARFLNTSESTLYKKSEFLFIKLDLFYEKLLYKVLANKIKFILSTLVVIILCFSLAPKIGLDFLPIEEDSEIQVLLESKNDLSLEAMKEKSLKVYENIKQDPSVAYAYLLIGYNDAKEIKKAKIYVKLKPLNERKFRQPKLISLFQEKLNSYEDLKIKVLELPKIEGAGIEDPVQIQILGDDLKLIKEAINRMKEVFSKHEGFVAIDDNEGDLKEEIAININREKAAKLGINLQELAYVLAYSFGNLSVGNMDYKNFKDEIILSFDEAFKQNPTSLELIELKNHNNESIKLASIASFSYKKDLSLINRHNKTTSIKLTSSIENISLGEVRKIFESNLAYILGKNNLSFAYSGFLDFLDDTISGFLFSISLGMILIYLILASLYSSLILPLIIMISMPLAFGGACFGIFITGNHFSLFVLVAIILLFGMVGKNAILLVDVANKKCDEGMEVEKALIYAGKSRLRAILMTTFAMIFSMLPLALSRGSGFEGNSPMAIAIIFGLISSTLLTLLVVPALFKFAHNLDVKIKKIYQREKI
ncbi:efflux RND transporter permease subunit [Campylobacter lari]|uniref:efflux RND transporter permease subunit n=1 Tax=Campylobacter lari TaxID=201 RepID=UPI001283156C|nr:efflux RND transporter permease subunit [Campylobacter lari]ECK1947726.1 efflux RND transporter permease subunit [Campylobacter lari]MBT0818221.1 efflux RND transporter permease subunit [Campylobacter lari]MBT0832595.1 efflux RND transporter permease subunit [Campylobacter lari]